jgi:uncharacterized OsmC-like protein
MTDIPAFHITLEQLQAFEFKVKFDWDVPDLVLDEPPPMGAAHGPNASRLLAAAVGNCLSASLLFCLQKSHVPVTGLTATVSGHTTRNEQGRLRLSQFDVCITLPDADETRRARCLTLFEDYCVVTQSVRQGIPVHVRVVDADGRLLHED